MRFILLGLVRKRNGGIDAGSLVVFDNFGCGRIR